MRRKVATAAVIVAVALGLSNAAHATQPDPNHKVTICHRTHSATNPYVLITVDEAAVDGVGNHDDHQSHNEGGAISSVEEAQALKANGEWWGDIIPPFYVNGDPGTWPSLNWDEVGQAVFENDCMFEEPEPSETPSPTVTPSPSDTPSPTVTPTDSETPSDSPTVHETGGSRPPKDQDGPPRTANTGRDYRTPLAAGLSLVGLFGATWLLRRRFPA